MAEKAATGINRTISDVGFESNRLKTGTPPRIDGRSLDYTKMEEQKGDEDLVGFSYLEYSPSQETKKLLDNLYQSDVHDILKTGFDRSPMFQDRIEG